MQFILMSKDEKLLDKMRRSKTGWRFNDIERLYMSFGFEKREGGRHTMFIHPNFPELRATVARHKSIPIGYIQFAVKVIDSLKKLQED